ncbi:MAG: glycosyltransferase family 4 protein [Ignavibacteria bacterium]|nr:glycosyltransferase family 4 protein [Ignavibacteria bacterium]
MEKVILTGSVPPPYHGSSIYFENLLNSEIRYVFEIHHLDISDHRNLDNLSRLDFTNIYIALKSIVNLVLLLRKVKPGLVYIPVASNYLPFLRDGLFILATSYFSKAKIIVHLHEGSYFREVFYNNSFGLYKRFINYVLGKVSTAIVFTEGLKSNFKGLVKNTVAFPNGIKQEYTAGFKPADENRNIRVNYLGNLFESKGILDILSAAEIVTRKYKNVEFNFAGAWSEKEESTKNKALKFIEEKNLRRYVNFKGVVTGEGKRKFLSDTDILVFPTWYPYEGCPLVIIEAMSCSVPVISTNDAGAIPEMIINGKTGILTDKKNPAQLAEAIISLISNKNLREKIGNSGREYYLNNFTMEINIKNIINTFYKALD